MRKMVFSIFMKVSRLFAGKGLGIKFPLLRRVKVLLFRCVKPLPHIVIITAHDNKMYAESDEAALLTDEAYLQKLETGLFKKIVKEGMTVVDLGAHIGYYTLIAARLVSEKGKVYAFEPEPDNYRLLVKNVELNGYNNAIPVQKAVSNQVGAAKLFLCPHNPGAHRIYNSHDGRKSIEVETITLDEFFKDKESTIDVLKMDIEGAEIAALQGMQEILRKNDDLKILSEFCPEAIRTFGYSPEDGLNELLRYGFKLFHIAELKGETTPIDIDTLMQMCSGETFTTIYIARH